MTTPDRRVLVYGNCQGGWLAQQLRVQPAVAERFEIVYLSDYLERPAGHPINEPDFLSTCSVVIWQTASTSKPPWFLGSVPAGCRQIRYPTLWLKLLWPTYAVDPRNQPEPNFPWGRYPYGDRLVMKLLEEGVSVADLPKRYVDTDLNQIVNLDRFTEMALGELRFNDQQSDIAITPFIEATFRQQKLFGTVNHPTFLILHRIYAAVAAALLEQAEPDDPPRPANAADVLGEEETPLHPQIISHFRLAWTDPNMRWRYHSALLSLGEYLQAYGSFTPIPLGNPPQLWLARAQQAAERNDLAEAQRILLAAAREFPSVVEFLHYLGVLLARRGQVIQAEKVLRCAIAQHPRVATLYCELGSVLLRRNAPDEAVRRFHEALRIDPQHPDARRILALMASPRRNAAVDALGTQTSAA